jgi:prevent-host-death family protein
MNEIRVSVAQASRSFTGLLRQVEDGNAVLVYRRGEFAGVVVSAADYERLRRQDAYFEAMAISSRLSGTRINVAEFVEESRRELEERG